MKTIAENTDVMEIRKVEETENKLENGMSEK